MDNTSALILGIALMIIMLGMGLSLTVDDFKRVLRFPKAVALGLLNQIVLLPLIGFTLASVLGVDPYIAVGIMILAACPGGPTSNLLSHLAKADVALSVTLTAINSLITIVTIPLIVSWGLSAFMAQDTSIVAPTDTIIKTLLMVIAVPLAIGMVIHKFLPKVAAIMDKPVRIFSAVLLFVIIAGLAVSLGEKLIGYFASALVIALALNILTMAVGFFSSKLAKLDGKQALTICLESGNQNGTLAITIAVAILQNEELAIAAAVYSLIMYVTAALPVGWGMRRARRVLA